MSAQPLILLVDDERSATHLYPYTYTHAVVPTPRNAHARDRRQAVVHRGRKS